MMSREVYVEMQAKRSMTGGGTSMVGELPYNGPLNCSWTAKADFVSSPNDQIDDLEPNGFMEKVIPAQTSPSFVEDRDNGIETLEEFLNKEKDSSGDPPRELGITWTDLTVTGLGTGPAIHENFFSQFDFLPKIRHSRRGPVPRTILDNCHGCVKPGEMLLVLGRPGSGCTTLLSILANRRHSYASVSGDVFFGSMNHKTAEQYGGHIVMNTEQELFFPSLTVGQTLDFATRLKVPFNKPQDAKEESRKEFRDLLLQSLGIEHTQKTKIGNEFIRGISGGERKRVSIAECLATRGSIFCWDNSTRGLDASTALQYIRVLRAFTDIQGLSTVVTLYQPGDCIYELFDKVLVLDQGQQIYFGPMKAARPFMEGLGFDCLPGKNIADFLTSVTVPNEQEVRPECIGSFPRSPKQVRNMFEKSEIYRQVSAGYDYPSTDIAKQKTELFKQAIAEEVCSDVYTVSFFAQVKACVVRQYQIFWGDRKTFFMKQVSSTALALILGSLFYNASEDSAGLFVKSGALFFALLYNTLIAMSEVADSFYGRPILLKHKYFAFNRLAAFHVAQVAADIPVIAFRITIFSVVLYFMVGLEPTARAFFTYWTVLFITALTMTALFRAIGAMSSTFDQASKWAGIVIGSVNLYTGYMFNYHQMHPWFVWIFWVDPLAYAFNCLLSNELHGKTIECVGPNLVPFGPGYRDPRHQSCAGVGVRGKGQTSLTGDEYLKSLTYSYSHLWRNFGILWPMWAIFASVTIFFSTRWHLSSERHTTLLIPREKAAGILRAISADEEAIIPDPEKPNGLNGEENHIPDDHRSNRGEKNVVISGEVVRNTSILTWKNLSYTVTTPSGDHLLLDNVHGWVKPGMLGALMGASGAGKTTLLDVLAQRKTEGVISGSILVDGRPLPVSFQRCIGFCEQVDVHEPFATVREALELSSLLRQDRNIPREEKIKYVQTILDLLDLNDLADALIGQPNTGMTPEQRKRVTIGVELVSKPKSSLMSQRQGRTVKRRLVRKGGKVAYFGEIGGKSAGTVKDYFKKHSAPNCPPMTNPAEYVIDVVSSLRGRDRDWNKVWLESSEYVEVTRELERIESEAAGNSLQSATLNQRNEEFAAPLWEQIRLITYRTSLSLLRNTDYVNNKLTLHIASALFNGFSFWMISDSISSLHSRLFTIFNFIFVAPGALNQLQPLFIERRDIFETREVKSKIYSWVAFTTAVIVSELPYLCVCAVLYFVCWYWTVGFHTERAGPTLFVMIMYEFVFTGIGNFVATCAPNAAFAAFASPVLIGVLVPFCGILVPYGQIQDFWRYWLYYVNPFTYLMGSMLVFDVWGTKVTCAGSEFAVFDPPKGTTCGQYLEPYFAGPGSGSTVANPDDTAGCQVCQFRDGSDYLRTLNLKECHDAWRDAGIIAIFAIVPYAMVFLLMKLRTGRSKKAKWQKLKYEGRRTGATA